MNFDEWLEAYYSGTQIDDEAISIESGEWPHIRDQIDKMVADIKQRDSNARDQSI